VTDRASRAALHHLVAAGRVNEAADVAADLRVVATRIRASVPAVLADFTDLVSRCPNHRDLNRVARLVRRHAALLLEDPSLFAQCAANDGFDVPSSLHKRLWLSHAAPAHVHESAAARVTTIATAVRLDSVARLDDAHVLVVSGDDGLVRIVRHTAPTSTLSSFSSAFSPDEGPTYLSSLRLDTGTAVVAVAAGDASVVAIGSASGELALVDPKTGATVPFADRWVRHSKRVSSLAVSGPDSPSHSGTVFASASHDGNVILFHADGRGIATLRRPSRSGRPNIASVVSFGDDGRLVGTGFWHNCVVLTSDWAEKHPTSRILRTTASVRCLSFSPPSDHRSLLAIGCSDGSVVVADARSAVHLHRLIVSPQPVASVRQSSTTLTAADTLGVLRVWAAEPGQVMCTTEPEDQDRSTSVLVHDGSSIVAGGTRDGRLILFDGEHAPSCATPTADSADNAIVAALRPHGTAVTAIDVLPLSSSLSLAVTGEAGGTLCVWHCESATRTPILLRRLRLPLHSSNAIRALSLTRGNGATAVFIGGDGGKVFWVNVGDGLEGGKPEQRKQVEVEVEEVEDMIVVADTTTPHHFHCMHSPPSSVCTFAGRADGTIVVMTNRERRKCDELTDGHRDWVTSLGSALVEEGSSSRVLVSGGADGLVIVWDLELKPGTGQGQAGKLRTVLRGHGGAVTAVHVRHLARGAVSAGSDGSVRVWDLKVGAALTVIRPPSGAALQSLVAVAPQTHPSSVVVVDDAGVTHSLSLSLPVSLGVYVGHVGKVTGVVATHGEGTGDVEGGEEVASVGADGRIVLWRLPAASRSVVRAPSKLTPSLSSISCLSLSPCARFIAMATVTSGEIVVVATGGKGKGTAGPKRERGDVVCRLVGHDRAVRAMVWIEEEHGCGLLVTSGDDGAVIVWSVTTATKVTQLSSERVRPDLTGDEEHRPTIPARLLAINATGTSVACGWWDGQLLVYNLQVRGAAVRVLSTQQVCKVVNEFRPAPSSLTFTAAQQLVVGLEDGTVTQYERRGVGVSDDFVTTTLVPTDEEVRATRGAPTCSTSFERDGETVVCCGTSKGKLLVVQGSSGKREVSCLEVEADSSALVAVSVLPDNRHMLSLSARGRVRLHRLPHGDSRQFTLSLSFLSIPTLTSSLSLSSKQNAIVVGDACGGISLVAVVRERRSRS